MKLLLLLPILGLTGCMTLPGSRPSPAQSFCHFNALEAEQIDAALLAAERWQRAPAFLLGLIEPDGPPWVTPRDLDWQEYRMQTEHWRAQSIELVDSLDFVGWFSRRNEQRLELSKAQTSAHYISLQIGQGGYSRLEYLQQPELMDAGRLAAERVGRWQRRFDQCQQQLATRGKSWWKIWN